jgi:hypothetical protein
MLYPASIEIVQRFWTVFDILKSEGGWGWEYRFIKAVGTNIGNLRRMKNNINFSFEVGYLQYVIEKYDVSAEWLLSGKGEMFGKKKQKEETVG